MSVETILWYSEEDNTLCQSKTSTSSKEISKKAPATPALKGIWSFDSSDCHSLAKTWRAYWLFPTLIASQTVQCPYTRDITAKMSSVQASTLNFHCVVRSVFLCKWKTKWWKHSSDLWKFYDLQWDRLQANGIVPLCLFASTWFRGNLLKFFPFPPLPYGANSPSPLPPLPSHGCHTSSSVHLSVKFSGYTRWNVDVSISSIHEASKFRLFTHWFNVITLKSMMSLKFKC